MPDTVKVLVTIAILLIAIPVLMRVLVSQANKRSITRAVFLAVICLLLIGLFVARAPDEFEINLPFIGTGADR